MTPERGSILLMVIFAVCLSVSVMLGAASLANLYATQKRLFLLADGASLAASQSFSLDAVTVTGSTLTYTLTDDDVRRATADYLARSPATSDVRIVTARVVSARVARVTLTTTWRPPMVSLLVPSGIPVTVSSEATGAFY